VQGRFITLEGIEGVGKSTNMEFVADIVRQTGHDVIITREPGGTPLAEQLRRLVLHREDEPVPALAELLIMFAGRCLHLENHIRPALDQGTWVICDRFTDATFAYQGGGRRESSDRIETLEQWVHGGLQPDLTILLDADPKVGLARAGARGNSDRFEKEHLDFFQRVRTAYLDRAGQFPDRIAVVDAGRSLPEVQEDIRKYMNKYFQLI
jgi:dTMP kinase